MSDGDTGRSLSIEEGAEKLFDLMDAPEQAPRESSRARAAKSEQSEADPEAEADATEETEEGTEIEAKPDDAEETDDGDEEVDEAEAEETEDTAEFTTLAELAQALEKSPDDLMAQLKTSITVHGKTLDVTLAELKNGYQRGRDYSEKTTELKQQREHFETTSRQAAQYLEQQMLQVSQIAQAAEQLLVQPLDAQQMEHLRVTNPGEWTARIQEHNAKAGFVQQLKQATQQSMAQYQAQAQAQREAALNARLEQERAKLASIPGWGEDLRKDLFDYLEKDYGYSESDLGQVTDHRIIDLVRKARAFDKLQAESNVAAKKVKSAPPKLIAPSKPEPKAQVKRSAIEQARARLKRTGSREDAASLIERML